MVIPYEFLMPYKRKVPVIVPPDPELKRIPVRAAVLVVFFAAPE
jgi:hypothetical protein